MTFNKHDPFNQYRSGKTAKVIKESDLKDTEWKIQLQLCKWIKLQYPNLLFRSDIQSAGKLSPQMQNIKQILDPFKSWPDVQIYLPKGQYIGLHIELKRINSGTFLKDGSLSSGKHVQEQAEMHKACSNLQERALRLQRQTPLSSRRVAHQQ